MSGVPGQWNADGAKLVAPPVQRNREAILRVLSQVMPISGVVLEVASGTGEHARFFAEAMPGLVFQPSDPGESQRASIDAWSVDVPNIRPALDLDASSDWPAMQADAVLCINMIHIAPWEATLGLLRNAAAVLPSGGLLITYGPYRRGGEHTAPSNAAFDADLRARDPRWGVRDLEVVSACAAEVGFGVPLVYEMPANNLVLVFRRTG